MNPSRLTIHDAILSWDHDLRVSLFNKASSSFGILKPAVGKMLAQIVQSSVRCLRLVENVLFMWSLGIL